MKINDMKHIFTDAANSISVGFNVAWATIVTGLLTGFDIFQSNAGAIATFLGICLTSVLIAVQLRNLKKTNIEIRILQRRAEDKKKPD